MVSSDASSSPMFSTGAGNTTKGGAVAPAVVVVSGLWVVVVRVKVDTTSSLASGCSTFDSSTTLLSTLFALLAPLDTLLTSSLLSSDRLFTSCSTPELALRAGASWAGPTGW